jgi:hypothetical protein
MAVPLRHDTKKPYNPRNESLLYAIRQTWYHPAALQPNKEEG